MSTGTKREADASGQLQAPSGERARSLGGSGAPTPPRVAGMRAVRAAGAGALSLLVAVAAARGATPLDGLRYSPDTSVELSTVLVTDHDVVEDDLAGGVTLVDVGSPGDASDLDAFASDGSARLLSWDVPLMLSGGVHVAPGDIARYDGNTYTIEFDASASGLPLRADADAVTKDADGHLLLSFDVSVRLDGATYDDEDLILWDGASFALFWDGSEAGIGGHHDLDAVDQLANGRLLVSFDGTGSVAGVAFEDEDVLEHDQATGSWELAFDGEERHGALAASDLDATEGLAAPCLVEGLGFAEDESTLEWTMPSNDACPPSYDTGRGSLADLAATGTWTEQTCLEDDDADTEADDAEIPADGGGFWYLVRVDDASWNAPGSSQVGDRNPDITICP
jgi:hypothetical protein